MPTYARIQRIDEIETAVELVSAITTTVTDIQPLLDEDDEPILDEDGNPVFGQVEIEIDLYPAELMATFEDVTAVEGIGVGWQKIGDTWQAPPPAEIPPAQHASALIQDNSGIPQIVLGTATNIASLNDLGTGSIQVNFEDEFSNANYLISVSVEGALFWAVSNRDVDGFQIDFADPSDTPADPPRFSLVVTGVPDAPAV